MPPQDSQKSISAQIQAVLALTALICLLGVLFPDSELIPFRKTLEASRTVGAATRAIRWLFLAGCLVCAVIIIARKNIGRGIATTVQIINRWSSLTFWAWVYGLALGLRLALFVWLPIPTLRSDGLWYHATGIAIAEGHGLQFLGEPTAYRPPGYPSILALTYWLFGADPSWAWLWGGLSTIILLFATHNLANRLYGESVARIATLIISSYPALILYTGLPLSDLVFTAGLMLICSITLSRPCGWPLTLGIGLALGLLTLTRSVSIGFFLIFPVLWSLNRSNKRKLLLHFVLLAFVFTACLAPWIYRNYTIFGRPTLTTNFGLMLYSGNHVGATGDYDVALRPKLLREPTSKLNEAQIDQIYLEAALQFIIERPLEAISILPKKIIHLFLLEVSAAQTRFQDKPSWFKYAAYGVTQLFYLPILIMFILRILNLGNATTRPHRLQWIGFMIIGYFVLIAMLFSGHDRYRLPFLPWMVIEGSILVPRLADFVGSPKKPRN
jgi:hypothetical protein